MNIQITKHWWDAAFPFIVRVKVDGEVLVEAYHRTREEQEKTFAQMRQYRDEGRLLVVNDDGVKHLEYVQQRSGDLFLLRRFSFTGRRLVPRWCRLTDWEADDKLYWQLYVENASAEAEA